MKRFDELTMNELEAFLSQGASTPTFKFNFNETPSQDTNEWEKIWEIRQKIDYALNSYEGEPVYVDGIAIGMDESGMYWVSDGEVEVKYLTYDGVVEFCLNALK